VLVKADDDNADDDEKGKICVYGKIQMENMCARDISINMGGFPSQKLRTEMIKYANTDVYADMEEACEKQM
jgi:hypothetical protein